MFLTTLWMPEFIQEQLKTCVQSKKIFPLPLADRLQLSKPLVLGVTSVFMVFLLGLKNSLFRGISGRFSPLGLL